MYPYGIIGNCSVSALIHSTGGIDWLCLPNPDSPPFFGHLLDPDGGRLAVHVPTTIATRQRYRERTAILETEIECTDGTFRITDFCPRSEDGGRMRRPRAIYRRIEPVTGTPHIALSCRPVAGWEKTPLRPYVGRECIHFESGGCEATLSSTLPPGHILAETVVALTEPIHLALEYGTEPIGDLTSAVEEALILTERWWHGWVRQLSLPHHFHDELIRSAITLKLACVEDTGAILAAPTTSLPEEWGGERNWDYRFCWLRDAAFVLSAFRNLGQWREMAHFVSFLTEIAEGAADLRPVYRADHTAPLPENVHMNWRGYRDSRPVRSNNQAGEHTQNDVYGEMLVTLAPIFLDERLTDLRTREHDALLRHLALLAANTIGAPDAGPWEFRSRREVHAFTALTAWAGLRATAAIHEQGYLHTLDLDLGREITRAARVIESSVVNGSVRNGPSDHGFDAALLLLPIFGYPDHSLNERTVRAIHHDLRVDPQAIDSPHLYRYRRADDFGAPRGSFVICSWWLVEALARLGHRFEAERLAVELLRSENNLGLFAEHFDPVTFEQSGNFPQAYSHVGAINGLIAIEFWRRSRSDGAATLAAGNTLR